MDNGKRICNFLKNIRKRIASENGIAYNPHECQFTGACKGTCPACENEIKYLERQIDARKKSGLPTKVTGIAISMCAASQALAQAQNIIDTKDDKMQQQFSCTKTVDLSQGCKDTVNIKGMVAYAKDGFPLASAIITVLNPDSTRTKLMTLTNLKGEYSIIIPRNSLLEISYIGLNEQVLSATELKTNSHVLLDDSETLQGEIVVIKKTYDDIYNRKTDK